MANQTLRANRRNRQFRARRTNTRSHLVHSSNAALRKGRVSVSASSSRRMVDLEGRDRYS